MPASTESESPPLPNTIQATTSTPTPTSNPRANGGEKLPPWERPRFPGPSKVGAPRFELGTSIPSAHSATAPVTEPKGHVCALYVFTVALATPRERASFDATLYSFCTRRSALYRRRVAAADQRPQSVRLSRSGS